MSAYRPGDYVLYRDGDRFAVARIDLVKDRHLTGFPFDTANRRWARRNRRIAVGFVLGTLPSRLSAAAIARRIEALRNQREAQRQTAQTQFEQNVRQLLQSAATPETPRP